MEFIELQDGDETAAGALKKPGGGKRKKNKKGGKRKKNKKKGHGSETQPSTLVVVQAAPEHHEVDSGHEDGSSVISHGSSDDTVSVGKPMRKRKHKRRMKGKRKRRVNMGQPSWSTSRATSVWDWACSTNWRTRMMCSLVSAGKTQAQEPT